MPYPVEMQESLKKVAATRNSRLNQEFRRLEYDEKDEILKDYHPDFRETGKTEIPFGPNKGDLVPNELAELIKCVIEMESHFLGGSVITFDGGISGCLNDPD